MNIRYSNFCNDMNILILVKFDNEFGIIGNVTLQFASDGGSFIRPITKRYGESVSLESYVTTKYGYTFKG